MLIKKYLPYVGYVLVLVSLYFVSTILLDNIHVFKNVRLSFDNLGYFFVFILIHMLVYVIFSYAWLLQVEIKYPEFGFKRAFSIIGRSQIGKYLPGNVGHFIGRLVLLPKGINKSDVTYMMFIENVVMVITATTIGSFYILYFDFFNEIGASKIYTILIAGVFFSFSSYYGVKFLRKKVDFVAIEKLVLIKILALSFFISFIGGVTIYLLVLMFSDNVSVTYFQCVTGFSLAFVVGFVIPGAPGGIGVRELAFVMLFRNFMPEAVALEIILAFRVISLIGDFFLFSVTNFIGRKEEGR